MNDKKHYYVSVSGKSVETEPSRTEQLQVMATESEINHLQSLLDSEKHNDDYTAQRAPIPYKSADHDPATDQFNDNLIEVYRAIYQLGTEETKQHIRSLNIIQELKKTDYNHPGYERK